MFSVQSITLSGTLSGVGTVTVTSAVGLDNSGTVNPGVNNVPGKLTLVGNYRQESSGTLIINVDTSGNFSVLAVQGAATLGGTLTVKENYGADPGTDLPFLTYNSFTGDFSSKSFQGLQMWSDPNHGEGYDHWIFVENGTSYDMEVVYQP